MNVKLCLLNQESHIMGVDFDVLFLKFANLEDKVHNLMFVKRIVAI